MKQVIPAVLSVIIILAVMITIGYFTGVGKLTEKPKTNLLEEYVMYKEFSINSVKVEHQDKEFIFDPAATWSFYLSDSDLEAAENKAIYGDAQAALKVALYYDTVKMDSMSSIQWMNIAANQGNVTAQLNMAKWYLYDPRYKNEKLAIFWLKEAENNGSAEAKELLEKKVVSETSSN